MRKNILKIPFDLLLGICEIFSFLIVSIWRCKLVIGTIFFTDTYINIYQFRCDIRKGVINRDKVAVGYIDGQLVIIIWEQVRELFRAKCTKKDFDKLEFFLWSENLKK